MAELRPYNPTIRDRIAAALMGDARPGSARANIVEGMMGSRGIGTTGMGLADLTPMGIPMAAQDAQRSAQAGDALGAGLNAMAVIPAAKAPVRAAQQGIRAYHGSPHSFDKFDMSKIGTGEGAQAYGHGMYFADNEGVAKSYKSALAQQPFADKDPRNAAWKLITARGDEGEKMFRQANAKLPSEQVEQMIADAKSAQSGHMYEVNIRANPDDFLDWDKPLGQQGAKVREALLRQDAKLFQEADAAYKQANDAYMSRPANMDPIAERDLQQAVGDAYFRMTTARGNADKRGSNAYRELAKDGTFQSGTDALREAGIPGIKYLDQGSRGAGEGSRNYVVFDDSLIDIVRKYGLAGLMMGGLGAGAMGGAPGPQYQAAPPQL